MNKISKAKKAQKDKDLQDQIENERFQSNLMKVALNNIQLSSIVINLKFEWPSFVNNLQVNYIIF